MSEIVVVGSFVQDLAFETRVFPRPGETRIGTFRSCAGGKGFNQAVAAHRQQVDTLFVGAVGADPFADTLRAFLASEKLAAALEECPDVASGVASIVVNEAGENLIVVAPGANDMLSTAHIDAQTGKIKAAKVVVCQLENRLAATHRALAIARRATVTTVLNPAPIHDGLNAGLLALADILVPNETEFAYLMSRLFDIRLDGEWWLAADDQLQILCRRTGVPVVLLTLGKNGAFVSTATNCYRVPATSVTPVDTTGAGDAFNGGLAAGLVRFDGDLRRAAILASRVAGLSTEKPGTAPAMPTRVEVETRFGSS